MPSGKNYSNASAYIDRDVEAFFKRKRVLVFIKILIALCLKGNVFGNRAKKQ